MTDGDQTTGGDTPEAPRPESPGSRPGSSFLSEEFKNRYRVEGQLGRGACGIVIRAVDLATNEPVAVKFLLAPDNELLLQRFDREAQLLARIRARYVVRIREVGLSHARPYMVMDFMPGGTLRSRMHRGEGLPVEQAARIVLQVLEGLSACHAAGIVHRDLKPENVLFDALNRAHVADLGAAKIHEDVAGLTAVGSLVGTPRYMAPEQVRSEPVCVSTDLYAVGAMFYEMLAGVPVFDARDLKTLLEMQQTAAPRPLGEAAPQVPPALAALIHRMLSKRIEDRPGTAEELALQIEAAVFDARGPVGSRGASGRHVRSRAGPKSGASGGMVKIETSRPRAVEPRVAALAAALLVCAWVCWPRASGFRGGNDERSATSSPLARTDGASAPGPGARASPQGTRLDHAGDELPAGAIGRAGTLRWRLRDVRALAFSAGGEQLVCGTGDGELVWWRVSTGRPVRRRTAHDGPIDALALATRPDMLASGARGDASIRLWNGEAGMPRLLTSPTRSCFSLAFSTGDRFLAVASGEDPLKVFDVGTGAGLPASGTGDGRPLCAVFLPGGRRLAHGGRDGSVAWQEVGARTPRRILGRHDHHVMSMDVAPDGAALASGSWDHSVRLWDLTPGQRNLVLSGHTDQVWSVRFAPDGSKVASGSMDGTVRLWNATSGHPQGILHTGMDGVRGVAFSPDGRLLAAGTHGRAIRIWDVPSLRRLHADQGHDGSPASLVFTPDARLLVSGGTDRTLRIWDVPTGRPVRLLAEDLADPPLITRSSDGRWLAAAAGDGSITVRDLHSGSVLHRLQTGWRRVVGLASSPAGAYLAAANGDRKVLLWDLDRGLERPPLIAPDGVLSLAFSPDGRWLATGGCPTRDTNLTQGQLIIWDHARLSPLVAFDAGPGGASPIVFSVDASLVGAATFGGQFRVWSTATDHATGGPAASSAPPVLNVDARSPQERFLAMHAGTKRAASTGPDGRVRLWNLDEARVDRELVGHAAPVVSAAFTPDGSILATGSVDTTILLWAVGADAGPRR